MVGVIILSLGLPQVFHSIDEGLPVDNSVTVAGYVVMRVAMLFLWLRARPGRTRRGAGPARPMPSPSVSPRSAGSYC
jgi:hypothetical protein